MITWIFVAVVGCVLYYIFKTLYDLRSFPPGPFPLPIIGNLHLISSRPYMDLTRLARHYGPVYRLHMGCNRVIIINSCAMAKEAMLKRGSDFSGRPNHFVGSLFSRNGKGVGFQSYCETWKAQSKAIITKIKDHIRKDKMESLILIEVEELISRMTSTHGPFNPRTDVTFAFGNIVSSLAFGQRYEDAKDSEFWDLMDALTIFVEGLAATSFIDTFPFLKHFPFAIIKKVQNAVKTRDRILNTKFLQHKLDFEDHNVDDQGDLTDVLIDMTFKASRGNPTRNPVEKMTEDHVMMTMNDTIMAGSETPTMSFLWILYFLSKYPVMQKRIQTEIDDVNLPPKWEYREKFSYVEAFITEVLRYVSVMPLGIPHMALRDTFLGPYKVPKGTTVLMNIYGIHHDPGIWDRPNEFVPERFLDKNGSFCVERTSNMAAYGLGHRVCPGEALARMETFLFTTCLCQRFNVIADMHAGLPDVKDAIFGITLRPADFKMAISPRH